MNYFMSKGWTREQAAGIVGNLQHESGRELNPTAYNSKERAYGIAQWHPDRQANFIKLFGHDPRQGTFREQLEFTQWELEHTHKRAGNLLKTAKSADRAAQIVNEGFEISASRLDVGSKGSQMRMANARTLAKSNYTPQDTKSDFVGPVKPETPKTDFVGPVKPETQQSSRIPKDKEIGRAHV